MKRALVSFMGVLVLSSTSTYTRSVYAESTLSDHASHQSTSETATVDQVTELRAKVARLEAALEQNHQGEVMAISSQGADADTKMGMKMGMMQDMSMMKEKRGIQGKGMGMMGMGNMKMMGKMKDKASDMSRSALPGFPGASHIYHVGATDFFNDHTDHIQLSVEQQQSLGQIREQALLRQASTDRAIEQAEQELWELTGSDKPNIQLIENKVHEIEKIKANQRIAFIQSVGEAVAALTDDQRSILVGLASGEEE